MTVYQITYNPDGSIESVHPLPAEPARKRVLFIRETSEVKARQVAKLLFSLAK